MKCPPEIAGNDAPPDALIRTAEVVYFNPRATGDYALVYRHADTGEWRSCHATSLQGVALRKSDGAADCVFLTVDRCLVLTAGRKLTPFADYFAEQHRERLAARAERLAEAIKAEVLRDVAAGVVPATVADFASLHDYVDANCYGGTEAMFAALPVVNGEVDPAARNALSDLMADAHGRVDAWIKSGGPAEPAAQRCGVCGHRADAPYRRVIAGRLAEHCGAAGHRPFVAGDPEAVAFLARYDARAVPAAGLRIASDDQPEANPWHE